MDENSCEGETSKGVKKVEDGQKAKTTESAFVLENKGVRIDVGGKRSRTTVSDRCGSSCDASGPSVGFVKVETENDDVEKSISKPVDKPPEPSLTKGKENEEVHTQSSKSTLPVLVNEEPSKKTCLKPVLTDEPPVQLPSAPVLTNEDEALQPATLVGESCNVACILPNYDDRPDIQTRVRLAPGVKEHMATRKTSIGPPPSYSFVMKQKKKLKSLPSPDPLVTDRPPPPTYTGNRGLFVTPEESRLERICNLPSFVEPVWRSHSQPALCPRCGVIVLTTTHSHDSVATHVAALALCLFGCWPCCLLPYCMNACKNTYHHCPICQAFLGLYTPW